MARDRRERGQGLVEFALVLPILVVLIVSVGELGLVFGKLHSLGYASREGANGRRAGARRGVQPHQSGQGSSFVDATLIGSVQRILTSPDSGIDLGDVDEIRIFKATSSGAETSNKVNIWTPPGPGPDIDPGDGTIKISFALAKPYPWPACSRVNSGLPANIESIGVTVKYHYDFVTPLPALLNAISGGDLFLTLTQTTVMALNPTV